MSFCTILYKNSRFLLLFCCKTLRSVNIRPQTINIQTVRAPASIYQYETLGRRSGAQPSVYSSSHILMRTRLYKAPAKQGLSNLVITHSSPLRCGGVIGCLQQRSKLVTPVLTVSLEHSDYAKWIDARARHLGRETKEILRMRLLMRRDDRGWVRGWKCKVGCTKKLIIKSLIQLIFLCATE